MDWLGLIFGGPAAYISTGLQSLYTGLVLNNTVPQTVWDTIVGGVSSITGILTSASASVFVSLINALPLGGVFPSEYHVAALYFGDAVQSVAFFLPVGVMVNCLSLAISVRMSMWAFHILMVLIGLVRGIAVGAQRFSFLR